MPPIGAFAAADFRSGLFLVVPTPRLIMLDTWKGLEVMLSGAEPRRVRANQRSVDEIRSIEPAELIALRKRSGDRIVVVDVRNSPKEMLRSTLPDAQVLSVEELEVRWRQLPQGATIVVYCWDEWSTLSARAVHLLTLRGLKAVELAGGIKRWRTLGLEETPIASAVERSRYH
jgi:rhodanese-related sulfurtransferase